MATTSNKIREEIKNCPESPNCVSTMTTSSKHFMEPWSFQGEAESLMKTLKAEVMELPRVTLKDSGDFYLHFVFTSKIMRFKDDVWFYIDDEEKSVHFKSASRTGYSDWGVNKDRMKRIKKLIF